VRRTLASQREEWAILAAHRQDSPWSGEAAQHAQEKLPEDASDCISVARALQQRVGALDA